MGMIRNTIARIFGAHDQTVRRQDIVLTGEVATSGMPIGIGGVRFERYNPSELVGRQGLRVFDRMRKDEQVKASLTFKKKAVFASGWEIVSPDDQSEDWEVTEFVRWCLEHIDGTLEHDISEILTSLDYGYSITEKIYAPITEGRFAGKIGLKELKTRHPASFRFLVDDHGNLVGIIQEQEMGGEKRLPLWKFVILVNDFQFCNWYGTSDLEACYRPWWSKDNAYKWLAVLIERLGIPPIFGLYDSNVYHGATLDRLKTAIEKLRASTVGIIPRPDKDSLDFWTPNLAKNATDVFIPAIEMYDKHIARALLMPNQVGMSPESNIGSYAKARVHFDVFMMVVEDIRRCDIEERVMNEQIIPHLVDINFPGVQKYPRFRFLPLSDEVTNEMLQTWMQLVGAGVVTKQPEDEKHIRGALRMPEMQDNGSDLPPDGASIPGDLDNPGTPPSLSREDQDQGIGRMSQGAFFSLSRDPLSYERKVAFQRIDRTLTRYEETTREALVQELTAIRDKTISRVRSKFNFNTTFINNLRLPFGTVTDIMKEALRRAHDYGREELRKELPRKFAVVKEPLFSPTAAIRYITQVGVSMSGVLKSELEKRVTIVLTNALRQGWTMDEIALRIEQEFEPFIGDESVIEDGQVLEPYRLNNIIRTNLTNAFNNGRLLEMRRNPDFIRAVMYSAIIDDRTTPVCKFLDGKLFKLGDSELETLVPPNHYQCRSVLVPVTIDEQVSRSAFITAAQIGRAKELSGKGFV